MNNTPKSERTNPVTIIELMAQAEIILRSTTCLVERLQWVNDTALEAAVVEVQQAVMYLMDTCEPIATRYHLK